MPLKAHLKQSVCYQDRQAEEQTTAELQSHASINKKIKAFPGIRVSMSKKEINGKTVVSALKLRS